MSYCRFSTDDYGSDVYVYADGIGFVTHVARSRLRFQEPLPPPETDEIADINRSVRVDQLAQAAVYEPISLPLAGQTFTDADAAGCLARLHQLRGHGYRVPGIAIQRLEFEIAESASNQA
jgi:hypothetical protein